MTLPMRRDRDGLAFLWQAIALVLAIVIASVALYEVFVQKPPAVTTRYGAQPGDTATIEYVGTFADTGKVFDTSYARVARDNVSYPKALAFTWRANWQPFSFAIGSGQAIKGFENGVLGMSVGDNKRVVVPPLEGYGNLDMSLVHTVPLLQGVPVREVMNLSGFVSKYGTPPANGLLVIDPFWTWNASVFVTSNVVTVVNSPQIGMRLRLFGAWDGIVESIDDSADNGTGVIRVRHLLTAADAGNVQGRDISGRTFIVSAVDPVAGTFTENYNREVVGRTLVFDIALTSIVRA